MTTDPDHLTGGSRGPAGRVTTESRDRVHMVGIDRPEKRNALTSDILKGLAAAYADYEADDDLRCAVLFGHGPVFCAGFDLTQLREAVLSERLDSGEDGVDPFGLSGRLWGSKTPIALATRAFGTRLAPSQAARNTPDDTRVKSPSNHLGATRLRETLRPMRSTPAEPTGPRANCFGFPRGLEPEVGRSAPRPQEASQAVSSTPATCRSTA